MSKSDPFFEELKEWGKYKHEVLGNYLRGWAQKLGSRSELLAFVDTCAGEGTYGGGKPGSPLIAAQLNDRLRPQGKRLLVLACEKSPEAADKLEAVLAPYAQRTPREAIVLRVPFTEALPALAEATRDVPTLFFVDPYGSSDVSADNLAPILGDRGRDSTEVLIRLAPRDLARFAGQLKRRNRSPTDLSTAQSFRKILKRLGVDDETLDRAEGEEFRPDQMELVEAYVSMLRERFEHVVLIPVRDDYNKEPKYLLVHGTDSEHGLVLMNDIVSKAEDNLLEATLGRGGQGDLFGVKRPPRVDVVEVKAALVDILRQTKTRTRLQLRAAMVEGWAAEMRAMHHNQIIKQLLDGGRVRLVKKGTRPDYDLFALASERGR